MSVSPFAIVLVCCRRSLWIILESKLHVCSWVMFSQDEEVPKVHIFDVMNIYFFNPFFRSKVSAWFMDSDHFLRFSTKIKVKFEYGAKFKILGQTFNSLILSGEWGYKGFWRENSKTWNMSIFMYLFKQVQVSKYFKSGNSSEFIIEHFGVAQ